MVTLQTTRTTQATVGPDMMKAIRMHSYGGPDVLTLDEAPRPMPGQGEALVRVRAASVNPLDWQVRDGAMRDRAPLRFPKIPGRDVAGVVEVVGPGVTTLRAGQAVYGIVDGSYAEYAVGAATAFAPAPGALDAVQAAAAPVAACTAWQGLFDIGGLLAGQTVLVQGAAGGVGTFAVQLAAWKGARVIVTARADDAEFVRSLGAAEVVDYEKTSVADVVRNVDLVLDLVGGATRDASWGVLKPGGMLVATSSPPSQDTAKARGVRAAGMRVAPSAALLTEIAGLLDEGRVKAVVGRVFPLAEAGQAQELSEHGHVRGKIVLRVAK